MSAGLEITMRKTMVAAGVIKAATNVASTTVSNDTNKNEKCIVESPANDRDAFINSPLCVEHCVTERGDALTDSNELQKEDLNKLLTREEILKNSSTTISCNLRSPITPNPFGLSVLQNAAASSPPPHSYRHSRAYRHFKNPPQPHMCIRTTTESGEELFINVLSWTRIVIPQEPSDPIPLYGGMRVPPGSPRSPPVVFAVMANPEVLKDSGRHSKDPEERRAMVELMCDFVEAMNPGIKLVRNAIILKDRDISGELKDVWNAVQAQRDREREEQMLQQRQQQQQHYHNMTNVSNGAVSATTQQLFPKSILTAECTPPRSRKILDDASINASANGAEHNIFVAKLDNNASTASVETKTVKDRSFEMNNPLIEENKQKTAIKPSTDEDAVRTSSIQEMNQLNTNFNKDNAKASATYGVSGNSTTTSTQSTTNTTVNCNDSSINSTINTLSHTLPVSSSSPAPSTKKDKLGGFLPNGCIFPRFKNNKHKDKDKDKEKDTKSKDKEKNVLLNALKSNRKDKKSNVINQEEKQAQSQMDQLEQHAITHHSGNNTFNKSCLNQLECEVQKLDLNKLETQTKANASGSVGVH
uniref:PIH1 N-terminal domain-containing protein n=1 Tax=Glossina austeni TaxID=7395 RepID=A0A1A9V4A8_GLOAU